MSKADKNPYPPQRDTHKRMGGGNDTVSGEKHGQRKATRIPADRRFSGAENVNKNASPGR
jgi:hypothetical protein